MQEGGVRHVEPGEAYEGDPIGHIRVCVTEEGAVFHPYNQIKE